MLKFIYEWEVFWENKEFLGFVCSFAILIVIGLLVSLFSNLADYISSRKYSR